MKENLELKKHKVVKKFSFSINEPYEKEVIGYGPYDSSYGYDLLPDFTGDSESQARYTANRLGISVVFRGSGGYVVSQNYPSGKRLDKLSGSVILTLSGSREEEEDNSYSNNITTQPEEDDENVSQPDTGTGTGDGGNGTSGGSSGGQGGSPGGSQGSNGSGSPGDGTVEVTPPDTSNNE